MYFSFVSIFLMPSPRHFMFPVAVGMPSAISPSAIVLRLAPCRYSRNILLTNEKYMGDALLQKTYTVDVLTKKRVSNNGIVPQYYVENNHEAIIPRQLFMQVQEELQRRAHLRTENGKTKRVYSSKYALSSIIYCGKCGDLFRRVAWKARGASYNKWRCASRIEKGPKEGCDADAISETEIQNAVVRAIIRPLVDESSSWYSCSITLKMY